MKASVWGWSAPALRQTRYRLRPALFPGSGKERSFPRSQSSCAAFPEMIEMPSPAATKFLMLCWSLSRDAKRGEI